MSKLVTGPFIASFVQVHEAVPGPDGGEPKFSIQMIFPEGSDLSLMNDAIEDCITERWGKKRPKGLKIPLRNGEEKDGDVYEGAYFMNARSKRKPGLVDKDRDPILEADEFYSGCIARAAITFFAYDQAGSKGVGVGLNNIQKLKDGQRLDGSVSAEREDGFADADDLDLDNL